MKLNFDTVREVLLIIEDSISYNEKLRIVPLTVYDISSKLEEISLEEVFYTLRKLSDGGYIATFGDDMFMTDIEKYRVLDITFKGHEYLNTVRDAKMWNEIKKKILVPSFNLVMQIAPRIIMARLEL